MMQGARDLFAAGAEAHMRAVGAQMPRLAAEALLAIIDGFSLHDLVGRMKLIALVTEPKSIVRYLTKLGEPTDVPSRSTSRGPSYWKSTVLRRKAWA